METKQHLFPNRANNCFPFFQKSSPARWNSPNSLGSLGAAVGKGGEGREKLQEGQAGAGRGWRGWSCLWLSPDVPGCPRMSQDVPSEPGRGRWIHPAASRPPPAGISWGCWHCQRVRGRDGDGDRDGETPQGHLGVTSSPQSPLEAGISPPPASTAPQNWGCLSGSRERFNFQWKSLKQIPPLEE